MSSAPRKAFPVVGAMFLLLAVWQFARGEDWVVWVILGVLFGGLGIFGRRKGGDA